MPLCQVSARNLIQDKQATPILALEVVEEAEANTKPWVQVALQALHLPLPIDNTGWI